ncbi:MAG TPA: 50S ribosomal protein L29 [Elusimicrobia bacterium]|nr:50S ribosomal protein L29 [Elusimicrobiota bacterium]
MAEKKKMLTQNKIDLASTELVTELRQALEKRAKLEFQHQVAPLKNPLELRHLRREIARLKTHIRMKEAVK